MKLWQIQVGDFTVTPLYLKGTGNPANHCTECGAPLPRWGGYHKKRSHCKKCNGKRIGKMGKIDVKPPVLAATQDRRRIKI